MQITISRNNTQKELLSFKQESLYYGRLKLLMDNNCFNPTREPPVNPHMCRVCGILFEHALTLNLHSLVHKKELNFDTRHVKNSKIVDVRPKAKTTFNKLNKNKVVEKKNGTRETENARIKKAEVEKAKVITTDVKKAKVKIDSCKLHIKSPRSRKRGDVKQEVQLENKVMKSVKTRVKSPENSDQRSKVKQSSVKTENSRKLSRISEIISQQTPKPIKSSSRECQNTKQQIQQTRANSRAQTSEIRFVTRSNLKNRKVNDISKRNQKISFNLYRNSESPIAATKVQKGHFNSSTSSSRSNSIETSTKNRRSRRFVKAVVDHHTSSSRSRIPLRSWDQV